MAAVGLSSVHSICLSQGAVIVLKFQARQRITWEQVCFDWEPEQMPQEERTSLPNVSTHVTRLRKT